MTGRALHVAGRKKISDLETVGAHRSGGLGNFIVNTRGVGIGESDRMMVCEVNAVYAADQVVLLSRYVPDVFICYIPVRARAIVCAIGVRGDRAVMAAQTESGHAARPGAVCSLEICHCLRLMAGVARYVGSVGVHSIIRNRGVVVPEREIGDLRRGCLIF